MEEELTYAKAGGPPADFWNIKVVHVPSGEELTGVLEADTTTGRLTRYKPDKSEETETLELGPGVLKLVWKV